MTGTALQSSWQWPRIETLGRSAYERAFGIKFIDEGQIDPAGAYGFLDRVIPSSCRYGLPDRLHGKSVAIVANSVVSGFGAEIDSHDEVIRMTSMRNWRRAAGDDGERATMWAGMASQLVKGTDPIPHIQRLIDEGAGIWCLSPFHITCGAYNFLRVKGVLERMLVLPPAAYLYELFARFMTAQELAVLYGMPQDSEELVGLSCYERLLTGTRLALLVEACGAGHLSLFGFDLFTTESERLWRGHDLAVDRQVLEGVGRRLRDSGRGFRWHGQAARSS